MKAKAVSAPYLVWMAIFIIVPMLLVAYFAFTDSGGAFTLDNIAQVGQYSNVFLRSIWLGALSTVVCLLLGYPVAAIVAHSSLKRQSVLIMLVMLPMWMNSLLRTYAWMPLLEDSGFMSKLDPSVIEAAQDLGADGRRVFLRVTLPLSMPGVISGVTMVFVPSVSTFIISKMLGGGGNLMIGDLIDMQFLGTAYNPNLGSAISLVLMVLILICMGIMNEFDDGESQGGGMLL